MRSNVCRLKRRYRRRWRVMWGTFTANMLSPMNQSTMSNSRYVCLSALLSVCLSLLSVSRAVMMESHASGRLWAPVSHYFLWILVWPMRPILAVNCRPQSSQMKDLVLSEDSAAGTGWLVEPFMTYLLTYWLTYLWKTVPWTSTAVCNIQYPSYKNSEKHWLFIW